MRLLKNCYAIQKRYGVRMDFKYPEGATPLDLNEIEGLIPKHVTTQEELNEWESVNILAAETWAFKQKDILNVEFIKNLHKKMFNKTWKWAGEFRTTDKNIGIHWSQISIKLKNLCDDVKYWIDNKVFSNDEIAIRFHHQLVFIHPFSNGNGRHARLMADMLITKLEGERFSWGMHKDLVHATHARSMYIKALRFADKGDFKALLEFARS